jgi:hypothetical protein
MTLLYVLPAANDIVRLGALEVVLERMRARLVHKVRVMPPAGSSSIDEHPMCF